MKWVLCSLHNIIFPSFFGDLSGAIQSSSLPDGLSYVLDIGLVYLLRGGPKVAVLDFDKLVARCDSQHPRPLSGWLRRPSKAQQGTSRASLLGMEEKSPHFPALRWTRIVGRTGWTFQHCISTLYWLALRSGNDPCLPESSVGWWGRTSKANPEFFFQPLFGVTFFLSL